MRDTRQMIRAGGMLATVAIAACVVTPLNGQGTAPQANFTNATIAEVRDAQGQLVLRGQFVLADEQDDDVERKAALEPTGVDADAGGEAEIEFSTAAPATQEIEFSVRNLQPGVVFTFVIDGIDVATATSDRQGRADVELDVRMPGTAR